MGEKKVDVRARVKSAPSAEVIEGFITDAIAVSEPQVPYSEVDLRLATDRLIAWYLTENTDLDRSVVFASKNIDTFIARGLPTYSEGSRGNIRAQLRRMSEALAGTARGPQRLAAAEATAPYRPKEIVRFGASAKK